MMSKLFTPLQVGFCQLEHRVIMAPLTRFRADDDNVPLPIAKEYYSQRASVPGTLIIAEATYISPGAGGYPNVPGIWSAEQITRWKEITDAVHAQGSYIFLQLWALGRVGDADALKQDGFDHISSSAVPVDAGEPVPRAMTEEEIQQYIALYAQAARNAIMAGFDGVELHGGNGYLVDQFTQDTCNRRTDSWGGSIPNRSRFAVEVTRAMVQAVGSERVAVKLTPWNDQQGMKMEGMEQQFLHLITNLKELKLAYLHLTNPRVSVDEDEPLQGPTDGHSLEDNASFVKAWGETSPVFLGGGYTTQSAKHTLDVDYPLHEIGAVFGRLFISNPDLPLRLKDGLPFTPYDRDTFYTPLSPIGYSDYPFSDQAVELIPVQV
ncbi:putative NADH-dependent flavin oxidoreductase [Aspergillus nomiae NRRL 13137]|uniref:Putative NADH-dependent flavin oxidoreductase n=1 Tax=Aspergillus nomiae NRRL (strain ATCC 15546 / NRRL 13137 / CBS 260.88 / M93) TaxID=1509407 RepID=A0A0L1JA97_ASPN3|nr:putative NADH-dependent flavin oxidoreductase [Aspergillus nomiae NRRL 13137]KNG88358.1 putative NADH-dependent flavin oxidoreductase [Aspergillus nomiae NRRL 13137]